MPTKEELELRKLEGEVKNLNRKFYKRPEFLSILVSSILGASALFLSISESNSADLKNIRAEKNALQNEINAFNKDKLNEEKKALLMQRNEIEESIIALRERESNLRDSLYYNYNRELIELEIKLKDIFDEHLVDESINYANRYVKSEGVHNAINKFIVAGKEEKFREWLYASSRRVIHEANEKSIGKVLGNIRAESKLNQFRK